MSEYIKGRLGVKQECLIPEAHADRPIGGSTNPIHDRDNYAHCVVYGRGRYHDIQSNLRRLAAAWNACEGMPTDDIEELAACHGVMTLTVYADDMLAKLNAARALLRDAFDEIDEISDADHEVSDRIKSYLDACDTLVGK